MTFRLLTLVATTVTGVAAESVESQSTLPREADSQFRAAIEAGQVRGVRALELIRADWLALTVDPALTGTIKDQGGAERFQSPEFFNVRSATDARYRDGLHPVRVGRESFAAWNGVARGPLQWRRLFWHTFYLQLPEPLISGHTYTVAVEKAIASPFASTAELVYDETRTTSKAIKINQVAYTAKARRRFAYLGWWAGDAGRVDYSALKRFSVVDETTDQSALDGDIRLRRSGDEWSGEDVYELDLSALDAGRYHLRIPGLARSETFHVGGEGVRDLYVHTMRAFFHQRCGQELREPWTWVKKPACHVECWESGHLVAGPGDIRCLWKKVTPYEPQPGETKRSFRGGYHDAADFDTFAYHLPAVGEFLMGYELQPQAFRDRDLNLPESGNGIPDVLDEAAWGLLFHLENQNADGSVPLGRGNECDAFKQNTDGRLTPYGVLPPGRDSTALFAAVAAQFARLVKPFDAASAQQHLAAARKAYVWSKEHLAREGDPKRDLAGRAAHLAWAAGELFAATGEDAFTEDLKHWFAREGHRGVQHWSERPLRWWAYVNCARPGVDKEIQDWMRTAIIQEADQKVIALESTAYRHSGGARVGAWGSMVPAQQAAMLLAAWHLTRDQKYLDAVSLNADFQLGCNPLSKTFITGAGYRRPDRPEMAWYLYDGPDCSGRTVKGLTMYTLGPPVKGWHPSPFPAWRSHVDLWGGGAEIWSEFTVHQTLGPTALMFAGLYAQELGGAGGGNRAASSR